MKTTLRRRSLLEMLVCVVLVAALAVQPALGRDGTGNGSRERAQIVTQAAAMGSSGLATPVADRTSRQVAATPNRAATHPAAPADPAPPQSARPAPAQMAPSDAAPPPPPPAAGADTTAPEDGDSGTPPAAGPNLAPSEVAAPTLAPAPAADQPARAPSSESARPVTPTPTPETAGATDREVVQPNAPVVTSQVAGPATATADSTAPAPPPGTASAPVPNALRSGTVSRHGASASRTSVIAGRGQVPRLTSATPAIDPATGGTSPATAISEPLRTPASAAITRVEVRPTGGVQTSRPPTANPGIPQLSPSPLRVVLSGAAHVIPTAMWIAVGVLGALVLLLGAHTVLAAARTRRLERQREKLMEDIGLLQAALLPAVPPRLGALLTTVAYRPADGPAAGGDFYDAFALPDGRVGLLLGDVSGHGRQALAKTTLVRFTVRAHLEAGMSPREAISVAGRSLDGRLADDFSTVLAAIHDPAKGTLTYASAGHPPPLVLGPPAHSPLTASSAPPIGVGFPTGQRQTVLPMPEGTTVAIYSDGLLEARIDGKPLGSERLSEWLADLGPEATAKELLDLVVQRADRVPDDLAAVVLHAAPGATAPAARIEQLKLDVLDIEGPDLDGFLQAAGISRANRVVAGRKVSEQLAITGGVIVEVRTGEHPTVSVSPIGDSAAAASRQTAPTR
jgi:sigma-B regulation protein RsbU (phosphoserine phosphatase)